MNGKSPIALMLLLFVLGTACNSNKNKNKADEKVAMNSNQQELYKKYNLDKISLPAGFTISVFAELPNARSMCWGAKGTLFVGNREGENVYAVVDNNKDGKADKVYNIGTGLHSP
ncbi:MAG: sorbosone dehydrogenase family protein, partial [Segetibacter sp.]|nr:sorbosone dehydrogenase family protein [Segetibacter sp.]